MWNLDKTTISRVLNVARKSDWLQQILKIYAVLDF